MRTGETGGIIRHIAVFWKRENRGIRASGWKDVVRMPDHFRRLTKMVQNVEMTGDTGLRRGIREKTVLAAVQCQGMCMQLLKQKMI